MLGLGLTAGAVSHAGAQTPQAPAPVQAPAAAPATAPLKDSLALRDSIFRADSIRLFKRDSADKADSVAVPYSHAERPAARDIGAPYHWDRRSIFTSGAVTLGDLLERVPGAMAVRTAWLVDPQPAAYAGQMGRVRVFIDGAELDALDPLAGGVADLGQLQLWMFEDVAIERAGEELRVHLRSWRTDRKYPQTRVEVLSGDRDANVFRGYYGTRFKNGVGVQAAFTNTSTTDRRTNSGDGQVQGYLLRLGWARSNWSVDAFAERTGTARRAQARLSGLETLPLDRPTTELAYLRAGIGDADSSGRWMQAMVMSEGFKESAASNNSRNLFTTPDTNAATVVLRAASRVQWVLSGGLRRGGLQSSLTARLRAYGGKNYLSPAARISWDNHWLGVTAVGERVADDSLTRLDLTARATPFQRLAFVGAVSNVSRTIGGLAVPELHWRGEIGVRLRGSLWVTGGLIHRDSVSVLRAPIYLDTNFIAVAGPAANGTFATIRGDLFRDIKAEVTAITWSGADAAFYLPKVQTRSQLYVESAWKTRFPSGSFGFLFAVIHEYRDPVRFPELGGGVQVAPISRNLSTLMEIRILSATLTWQFRNALRSVQQQAPGFLLPRGINFYGVRWDFSR